MKQGLLHLQKKRKGSAHDFAAGKTSEGSLKVDKENDATGVKECDKSERPRMSERLKEKEKIPSYIDSAPSKPKGILKRKQEKDSDKPETPAGAKKLRRSKRLEERKEKASAPDFATAGKTNESILDISTKGDKSHTKKKVSFKNENHFVTIN